jgi:4'-phosphopantetheinyl transferase
MHTTEVGPASVAWAATSPGPVRTRPVVDHLSQQDRARAAGFGVDRRREFVLGRSLVAALVDELFPDATGWSLGTGVCGRCGERHGPVELAGVPAVAGVSYARGLVVAALAPSPSVGRLGVDVELDAADTTRTRDLERLLGRNREPVLRRWTRIEAVLKADGRGLLVEPGDVRLRGRSASIAGDRVRYQVAGVDGPPGYVVSLAWCGAGSSAASSDPATG